MGYRRGEALDAGRQLHLDFETHTAIVRSFIERHFGRESLADPSRGNVADLVLSVDPPEGLRRGVLARIGVSQVERAFLNLRQLAGEGDRRDAFVRLAILACDQLARVPDPDMALNNWERFVSELPDPAAHYRMLLSQPRRCGILLGLFAGSQFLADTLIRNPEFLDWVTDPEVLQGTRSRQRLESDLQHFVGEPDGHEARLDRLRRFRRRELLRIGTRDMCLQAPVSEVVAGLSALADTIVDASLAAEWKRFADEGGEVGPAAERFCVLALGKLGGAELNYSSDIDLVGIYDDAAVEAMGAQGALRLYARLMERLRTGLSAHTAEGYAYRVDLRLRPHGSSGALVQPVSAMLRYYEKHAALWEIQALLKARPVAGAVAVGRRFMRAVTPTVAARRPAEEIAKAIHDMRDRAVDRGGEAARDDVKSGVGGIRDVEFLVQGLQLRHLPAHPELLDGNTLCAIEKLVRAELMAAPVAETLRRDYCFLRRVEHTLQILEDRQIHALPSEPAPLLALARRVMGTEADTDTFRERLEVARSQVRAAYTELL
jgi:glutamate-ammonia-ligase adenylyltransferase